MSESQLKDEILVALAGRSNVAQFVSASPNIELRYVRIRGLGADAFPASVDEAVNFLLEASPEHSVNVRSFRPGDLAAQPFAYGIRTGGEAMAKVTEFAQSGLYTIVNETVDVADGGVSGVVHANAVEFAPEDTPRAVESAGVAGFPRKLGMRLLEMVYGFAPELPFPSSQRVEFSIHPLRRGYRRTHTIVWEAIDGIDDPGTPQPHWPNRFSRFLGDKVFGLLLADLSGFNVPRTTVVSRKIAPYTFGQSTKEIETWLRTAPAEPAPGQFTTLRGWSDPFQLMSREDPDAIAIMSVLAQESVGARFSGAAALREDGLIVEGTAGFGDRFMSGEASSSRLPAQVKSKVIETLQELHDMLDVGRIEWAFDGAKVWILQAHQGPIEGAGATIFPGAPSNEVVFDVAEGLAALQGVVEQLAGSGQGIVIRGDVGLTSHFGDLLRRHKIPSRIEQRPESQTAQPQG